MSISDVNLRPAQPNAEDGLAFAKLFDFATGGALCYLYGRNAEPLLVDAFSLPNHDYSYEYVVIAEIKGNTVGMASGYSHRQHAGADKRALQASPHYSAIRTGIVSLYCAGLLGFLDTLPPDYYYLQAIAIDPDYRGAGIGSKLIASMESRARKQYALRFCLDVALSNQKAIKLYERCGMSVEAVSPKIPFVRDSAVARMVKELQ